MSLFVHAELGLVMTCMYGECSEHAQYSSDQSSRCGVTGGVVSPVWWCHRCGGVTGVVVSPVGRCHWCGGVTGGVVSLVWWCHWCGGVTGGVVSLVWWCHLCGGVTGGVVSLVWWCHPFHPMESEVSSQLFKSGMT